jgi:hypothetical protein
VSCGLTYLLEGITESGAIGAVAGLYCEVISNSIVIVVRGVGLQNGKGVVGSCWWTSCKRQMFDGLVRSCDVVGVWNELCVGGGAILHALACVTLGDGSGIGTLGYGVVGNYGCSTFGDGVSVASRFSVPWWRVGRRISHSFSMA